MFSGSMLRSRSVADWISVAVVLGAATAIGLKWQSGAIDGLNLVALRQMTAGLAAEVGDCGVACEPEFAGISGNPAIGMPYLP